MKFYLLTINKFAKESSQEELIVPKGIRHLIEKLLENYFAEFETKTLADAIKHKDHLIKNVYFWFGFWGKLEIFTQLPKDFLDMTKMEALIKEGRMVLDEVLNGVAA